MAIRLPKGFGEWLAANITARPTECWEWPWDVGENGYGRLRVVIDGVVRQIGAHRFMFQLLAKPVPDHLQIDHLCRVRSCCNPAHLEPVTPRVNTMRGDTPAARNAAKTHCAKGHEYTWDNTYISGRGHRRRRVCRACQRKRQMEYLQRKRGAA